MKKITGNWKFILALTLLGLYGLFFLHLHQGEIASPHEGWSRQIKIGEVTDGSFEQMASKESAFSLGAADGLLHVFYMDHGALVNAAYDKGGTARARSSLPLDLHEAQTLKVHETADGFIVHILGDHVLTELKLAFDGSLLSRETISDSALFLSLHEDSLFFCTRSGALLVRKEGESLVLARSEQTFLAVDTAPDPETPSKIHLTSIQKDAGGKQLLHHGVFERESGLYSEILRQRFPSGAAVSLRSLDTRLENGDLFVLYSQMDYKSGSPLSRLDQYDLTEGIRIRREILNLPGMDPSPVITGFENGKLTFMASVETRKGLSNFSDNLFVFSYGDGVLSRLQPLTKTNAISLEPHPVLLEGERLLQWSDLSGDRRILYLAGSDPDLVEKARTLLPEEWTRLFMDSLTGLAPILFMSLFPLLSTYAVVVAAIALLSFFKLNLMERHSKRITFYAIGVHFLLKLWFTFNAVSTSSAVKSQLPAVLRSGPLLYLWILAGTLIAFYCLVLKTRGEPFHFWSSYSFFALVDILIYSLMVLPYYYTYMLLPYFFN